MTTSLSSPFEDRNRHAHSKGGEYWRGILYGVIPLAIQGVIGTVALTLAALVRQLIGVSAFLVEQRAVLIILSSGLFMNLTALTLAVIFVLRCVAVWQRDGRVERVRTTLWTLSLSALVMLLPIFLALMLPQHPAQ